MGKVYSNLMINMPPTNEKLLRRATRIVALATDTDEREATELLRRSNGRIDVAIVMHDASLDAATADETVRKHDGKVRQAIEYIRAIKR